MTNSSPHRTQRHNQKSVGSETPMKTPIKFLSWYIVKKGEGGGKPQTLLGLYYSCRTEQTTKSAIQEGWALAHFVQNTVFSFHLKKEEKKPTQTKESEDRALDSCLCWTILINSIYHSSMKCFWVSSQPTYKPGPSRLLQGGTMDTRSYVAPNALLGASLIKHEVWDGYRMCRW